MCTDYKVLGLFPEFKGMLNYDLCMQKCAMELEVIHCGCIQVTYEFTASYPAPTCDFTASGDCFSALTANGTYEKCKHTCGLPCEERFTLKLRYRSDTEELVLYQPTLTRIELMAYAAGYLGIWLGVSVMTFLLDLQGWMKAHKLKKKGSWIDPVIAIR
ncbi:hypothetical protein MTO96_021858 [Rhipicephalus appendiculatus]